jgi:16S rRNA (guanine(966)-N(2))-methyltransferase RsmD
MPRPPRQAPSAAQTHATRKAPHHIRIIGGAWKRTPLPVLDLDGLRPTPDRVRETLFNWLGQSLDGQRCLDLFAGSGALGFEAASRGAARVVMVERHARAVQQLRANQDKLAAQAVHIVNADALRYAATLAPASFEVVLLDPPFEGDLLARAVALCLPLLSPAGAIYIEAPMPLARLTENQPDDVALRGGVLFPTLAGWTVTREGRAGAVHYHLLRRKNEE